MVCSTPRTKKRVQTFYPEPGWKCWADPCSDHRTTKLQAGVHIVVVASGVASRMRIGDDQYTPCIRAGEELSTAQTTPLAFVSLLLCRVAELSLGGGHCRWMRCPLAVERAVRRKHRPAAVRSG